MDDLFGKMQELLSDPESMQQLSELAQMLQSESEGAGSSEQNCEEGASDFGGLAFDPLLLMKLGELLGSANQPDENTALLLALRPHLRSQRRERVDRAVRLLRMMTIFSTLKENGMLQNFL